MKTISRFSLLLIFTAHRIWAQPLVNIETVRVGDTGNLADTQVMEDGTTGYGAVAYEYLIGKTEVTIGQYTTFLNSVASTNTNSYILDLWHWQMAEDSMIAGISRSGNGTQNEPYVYHAIGPTGITVPGAAGSSNRPIAYINWFMAARFCNWLHNGATNGASTEDGAYTLNGATNGFFTRNPTARWWIPSENEWYKAAYYKGNGSNGGYWRYPTRSDEAPGHIPGTGTNRANYRLGEPYTGVLAVTQTADFSGGQNYLTEVAAFSGSPSSYGTFDQGGNVWEWTDQKSGIDTTIAIRGGVWDGWDYLMTSAARGSASAPEAIFYGYGFRIAGSVMIDSDGDGLRDDAEVLLQSLGFDATINESPRVVTLFVNPNNAFLYTKTQFDNNRTAGQSDVINNPMSYGLYTSNSIMDLRMDGLMIQKIGTNAVVSFQPQTTTDLTLPFTNNGTPITNTIPMPGDKGFLRINAKP